jgi:hypothetical protein
MGWRKHLIRESGLRVAFGKHGVVVWVDEGLGFGSGVKT